MIVSIAQVTFSSVTLYNARGDQLKRYGYAAFSLTVVPYLVMSIVNLLGNLSAADFPAIYLVHSPELDEAKTQGGEFDSVIGRVVSNKRALNMKSNPRLMDTFFNQVLVRT